MLILSLRGKGGTPEKGYILEKNSTSVARNPSLVLRSFSDSFSRTLSFIWKLPSPPLYGAQEMTPKGPPKGEEGGKRSSQRGEEGKKGDAQSKRKGGAVKLGVKGLSFKGENRCKGRRIPPENLEEDSSPRGNHSKEKISPRVS